MKKIVILLVAMVISACALLTACGDSTGYSNKLTGFDASVKAESNGGFAVVKGDYLYFINGVQTYTADNTYGDVVTGALVRIKTSDLANTKEATAEMVIPALFVAGDKTSGFYIFGNDVYYASPVTAKNKEGVIENSKLNFIKTSLTGSTSNVIATVDDNTTAYRYVEVENVVYLVLKTVNEDSETVLKVFNASEGKELYTTEKVDSVIFSDSDSASEVYYTRIAHDEVLDKDEAFNEVHRVVLGAEIKDEMVLSGKGLYGNEEGDQAGFGIQGVTFTLVKDTNDTLFIKGVYVDTSVTTVTNYFAVNKSELVKDELSANQEKLVLINGGTASAESIFAATSNFVSAECIVYLDATHGIVKYEYNTTNPEANDGRVKLFYDKDLVGYTVKFWDNGYLYVADSSNLYYRVNVGALLDNDATNDDVSVEKVNFIANATDWYLPEVFGDYFLSIYTGTPYNSMVFVSDMKANAELSEEDIEKIGESTEEQLTLNLESRIGLLSTEMKEEIETYFEETFSDDKE